MKKLSALIGLSLILALGGCVSGGSGAYKGSGGMAAHSIKPEVYAYHYDHGFTGPDAMGWDPNLQYAWSRTGAARVCGAPAKEEVIIKNLKAAYGQDDFVHKLNGVDFHYAQVRNIGTSFCTPERVEEMKAAIAQFEASAFPKKY